MSFYNDCKRTGYMFFKHTLTHSIFVISEKFVSLCRKPFKNLYGIFNHSTFITS